MILAAWRSGWQVWCFFSIPLAGSENQASYRGSYEALEHMVSSWGSPFLLQSDLTPAQAAHGSWCSCGVSSSCGCCRGLLGKEGWCHSDILEWGTEKPWFSSQFCWKTSGKSFWVFVFWKVSEDVNKCLVGSEAVFEISGK